MMTMVMVMMMMMVLVLPLVLITPMQDMACVWHCFNAKPANATTMRRREGLATCPCTALPPGLYPVMVGPGF